MQACWLLLLGLAVCGRAAKLGPPTRVQLGEGVAKDDFYTTQIKLRGEQRAVRRPIIGPVNRWQLTQPHPYLVICHMYTVLGTLTRSWPS